MSSLGLLMTVFFVIMVLALLLSLARRGFFDRWK